MPTANAQGVPALMGVHEVAQTLGVTRQRASQLAFEHPQFPAPVAELACGPIWLERDIVEFAAIPRRPGRPRKESVGADT